MGRVWLEAATLAHTAVDVRKVKNRCAPRKKSTLYTGEALETESRRGPESEKFGETMISISGFDFRSAP